MMDALISPTIRRRRFGGEHTHVAKERRFAAVTEYFSVVKTAEHEEGMKHRRVQQNSASVTIGKCIEKVISKLRLKALIDGIH
jgi:hypothetical protein